MTRRRSDPRQLESEKQHTGTRKLEARTPSTFIATLYASSEGSTWEMARRLIRRPGALAGIPRKEVIQPHLPVRLPCYDFTPVTDPTLDICLPPKKVGPTASGVVGSHGVTGGVYKARERIHRGVLTHGY